MPSLLDFAGSPTNTSTTTSISSAPAYSQPYIEDMLGKAAAQTDIKQNPYMPYAGQRVANTTGMQNQALGNIAGMGVSSQTGDATSMAQDIFDRSKGMNLKTTGQFTDPGVADSYMNPYFKDVVDWQTKEAARQSGIAGLGIQSQAVQRGAYGGSREALLQSERERNLATQQAGITATGGQNAYNAAQQAFMADQARQLQADQGNQQARIARLNVGLGAANLMGTQGTNQYQQQTGINQQQMQAGTFEQQLKQQNLENNYQDYLNNLNYPYKNLAFMQGITSAAPGAATTQQMYTAPPNILAQLAGAGIGAYSLGKLFGSGTP